MMRAQTAIEYLFMLAAVLILVAIVFKVVLDTMRTLSDSVSEYSKVVREKLLENL
ncbi:class III signal peptide-containing protein [Pyrococcus sp. NA2]|uniref:class III signal peptide-containing protein n=1 Tax=Pyrococcus sp. (strain NA2) TaxID=342949 RepID=UPI0011D2B4B2|nr:class III signal peptide-containing protein [Pyrococcus sp. NA2]